MSLFTLNFNFEGIFKYIFRKENTDELETFIKTIQNEDNNETIISEILLKIVNGFYTNGLLYKYTDNNIKSPILIKQIGYYEYKMLSYFQTISIPIYIENKLEFQLILTYQSKKIKKLSKKSLKLIYLLENYLTDLKNNKFNISI